MMSTLKKLLVWIKKIFKTFLGLFNFVARRANSIRYVNPLAVKKNDSKMLMLPLLIKQKKIKVWQKSCSAEPMKNMEFCLYIKIDLIT